MSFSLILLTPMAPGSFPPCPGSITTVSIIHFFRNSLIFLLTQSNYKKFFNNLPFVNEILTDDRLSIFPSVLNILKIVKNITSKGFVRSNYEEKLVDLSDVRINLKSKN